jgi:hypothetical protein
MTPSRALRLYNMEVKWASCGSGDQGRNKGKSRAKKKGRQHAARVEKLRILAGAK